MKSAGSRTIVQELSGPSTSKKLLACLSYGTVSVSITLFNKAVFSVYGFHYPNFVTTLQIVVSILYMNLLKGVGLFYFAPLTAKGARQVRWHFTEQNSFQEQDTENGFISGFCLQILPLVICWWLYVVSGVTALRYLTVPMFRYDTSLAKYSARQWVPAQRHDILVHLVQCVQT